MSNEQEVVSNRQEVTAMDRKYQHCLERSAIDRKCQEVSALVRKDHQWTGSASNRQEVSAMVRKDQQGTGSVSNRQEVSETDKKCQQWTGSVSNGQEVSAIYRECQQ